MENTVIDIKNSIYKFKYRLDTTKERISELEEKKVENIFTETWREIKGRKIQK